jgi:hypothetical protein
LRILINIVKKGKLLLKAIWKSYQWPGGVTIPWPKNFSTDGELSGQENGHVASVMVHLLNFTQLERYLDYNKARSLKGKTGSVIGFYQVFVRLAVWRHALVCLTLFKSIHFFTLPKRHPRMTSDRNRRQHQLFLEYCQMKEQVFGKTALCYPNLHASTHFASMLQDYGQLPTISTFTKEVSTNFKQMLLLICSSLEKPQKEQAQNYTSQQQQGHHFGCSLCREYLTILYIPVGWGEL